jgi:IS1 family transposase
VQSLLYHNIGNRELEDARNHLRCIYSKIIGTSLFVSDELSHYGVILKDLNHTLVPFERSGKRGRPKNPLIVVNKDLFYATVKKTRKEGRITSVERNIVFGSKQEIEHILERSPSKTINTSYVERSNGTLRLWDSHLTRKSLTFAKSLDYLHAKLSLLEFSYNFIKPHSTLSKQSTGRKVPVTPAMAAGIANRPWTYPELIRGSLYGQ